MGVLAITLSALAAATLGVAGCGGPGSYSGPPPDELVSELSREDMRDLCVWVLDLHGGAGSEHLCSGGVSVTLDSVDECVRDQDEFDDCSLTVRQWEDCVLDTRDDPCGILTARSCRPVAACYF
ncbi:hypothetical protein [Haliangium sp.]|uniref:hypothetical protein n=1 Tax=Haliangium sp. TaxID=2663208 RepID=UPI003D0BC8D6